MVTRGAHSSFMARSKRSTRPAVKRAKPRMPPPSQEPFGQTRADSRPPGLLEQIKLARVAPQQAEAELAKLIDHAVDLGIGWPQIPAQLGVTRQAARQHYQRRHHGVSRHDHL